MPSEEKLLTIPLRREWLKKDRIHRTSRSIVEIKSYIFKNLKASDVKMSELLNESLWKGGAKKAPNKVKIKASKDEKGIVTVMLPEEKLVLEEKKGIAAKILRRKGKVVKKIVLDKPKAELSKTEPAKIADQKPTEPTAASKPAEAATEIKKQEEKGETKTETKEKQAKSK